MSTESESQIRSKKEMTPTAKYLNVAVLVVLLGVSAYIIGRIVNDLGVVLFTYHPTFMVLAYLILMSNAILIMADSSILTSNLTLQNRITAHWIVQLFAILLLIVAQICIFTNKVNLGKSHFQTTHSIFGLITVILTILTAIGGVFTKYAIQLRNYVKPVLLKCFHSFGGLVAYILALITMILGFNQMWHEDKDDYIKPILIILILIAGFFVIIKSFILFLSRFMDILRR